MTEEIMLQGPVGKLEAILAPPLNDTSNTIAVICHPHPQHGGTMNNKVVTTLARAFHDMNLWTVRFNFRGVGKSEGSYGKAVGEVDDLWTVLSWVKNRFPDYLIWLAGFSFGSHIAAQVASKEHTISQLISIAPPVNHFNFDDTDSVACHWLVIMGKEDEVVPMADVKAWLHSSSVPIRSIFLPDTSHFFHGKLTILRETLKTALICAGSAGGSPA